MHLYELEGTVISTTKGGAKYWSYRLKDGTPLLRGNCNYQQKITEAYPESDDEDAPEIQAV
jgi:hypothetical protein